MKAAIFTPVPYMGPAPRGTWPVPTATYSNRSRRALHRLSLEQFELADQAGFDWVTVAEHHFAPMSLTPNPMVMAGALTQRVKRAKIALLGANIPILNPVRVAEEFAMLDAMTGGRVVAGMLRGTSNEYVTYGDEPGGVARAVRRSAGADREGVDGARAVRLARALFRVPHDLDLAAAGAGGRIRQFICRGRPGVGRVRGAQAPVAGLRGDDGADRVESGGVLPRAGESVYGWAPTGDNVLYRLSVHVADTDEQAMEDLRLRAPGRCGRAFRCRTGRWTSRRERGVLRAGHGERSVAGCSRTT